ncbi:MAG: NAD(P)H-dependent oxidoreductase [Lachnospiraceae bacterium]|nr:NAD(P)H-dependent oxidoreductase [Lachnospiraceae bacterium]
MRIVMLNGQDHKGSTYNIGRQIADKISGENEIVEFFFPRDLNHFCMGCYKCIEDMSACPFYKEKKVILDEMDAADILIITTPTYCLHVSAPLKSFFDLTFDIWMSHRPMKSMFSKRAVIVSTSAGASTKHAMKDVEDVLDYIGLPSITKYGLAVQAMNWEGVSEKKKGKIDKATSKIAKKLSTKRKPRVRIKTKFLFNLMRMMQKKGWNSSPVETVYWKDNGWLDKARPWND